MKFEAEGMVNFWTSSQVKREYSELYNGALEIIIQFASTYLCEKEFSSLTLIKTKYRNRLDVCDDLRLKLTSIQTTMQESAGSSISLMRGMRPLSIYRPAAAFVTKEKNPGEPSNTDLEIYDVSIICQPDRSRLVPVAWQQWSEMEALIPSPAACEVRSVIKFFNAQSIASIEIHRQLCQVYGPNISLSLSLSLQEIPVLRVLFILDVRICIFVRDRAYLLVFRTEPIRGAYSQCNTCCADHTNWHHGVPNFTDGFIDAPP
ncbi:hypothetical protein ANN_02278 [Periplaneta americana]|uniref:HAT C-terminal dimerisation domain-containing protein n=1 Tax=Periplaneta americana TaxID=6978 RepID=A0ABQ8TXL4_PERAM|nr:hypothetical protein ANN_02278 [Periplaneta americana]